MNMQKRLIFIFFLNLLMHDKEIDIWTPCVVFTHLTCSLPSKAGANFGRNVIRKVKSSKSTRVFGWDREIGISIECADILKNPPQTFHWPWAPSFYRPLMNPYYKWYNLDEKLNNNQSINKITNHWRCGDCWLTMCKMQ